MRRDAALAVAAAILCAVASLAFTAMPGWAHALLYVAGAGLILYAAFAERERLGRWLSGRPRPEPLVIELAAPPPRAQAFDRMIDALDRRLPPERTEALRQLRAIDGLIFFKSVDELRDATGPLRQSLQAIGMDAQATLFLDCVETHFLRLRLAQFTKVKTQDEIGWQFDEIGYHEPMLKASVAALAGWVRGQDALLEFTKEAAKLIKFKPDPPRRERFTPDPNSPRLRLSREAEYDRPPERTFIRALRIYGGEDYL